MSSLTPRLDRVERNFIHNGNFDFWQRGTGPTAVASAIRLADRMAAYAQGAPSGLAQLSRSTTVPDTNSQYSFRIVTTSSLVSPTGTDLLHCDYHMEGNDVAKFYNKAFTVSFYCRFTGTGVTGIYTAALRNQAQDRIFAHNFTVTSSGVWQKVTFNVPASWGGAWTFDNARGMSLNITLSTGPSFKSVNTVNDTWSNTTAFCTTAHTGNLLAASGNEFLLSKVQLVEGTHSDPEFTTAGRNYSEELQLCQRYYERFTGPSGWGFDNANSSSQGAAYWSFKEKKRATPTLGIGSTLVANSRVYTASGLRGVSAIVPSLAHIDGGVYTVTLSSVAVQYQAGIFAIIASGTEDYMSADAEM
jgi:hypothetical protein